MKIFIARYFSLFSYLVLLAYMMWWVIDLSNAASQHISIMLLMYVGPLLMTLRGVLHARDKGLIWSSLISLLYLVHGGMVWWADPALTYWGLLELSLALIHLVSSSLYVRWRRACAQQICETSV